MVNLRGYESNLSSIKAPSWRDIFFTIAFLVGGHIYGMHGWLGTQIPGGNWHPLDEYDFTPHYPNDLELESRTAISASSAVLCALQQLQLQFDSFLKKTLWGFITGMKLVSLRANDVSIMLLTKIFNFVNCHCYQCKKSCQIVLQYGKFWSIETFHQANTYTYLLLVSYKLGSTKSTIYLLT